MNALKKIITERQVPDSEGWYWVKIGSDKWKPIFVIGENKKTGWGITAQHNSYNLPVTDSSFEWGPEIPLPEKCKE